MLTQAECILWRLGWTTKGRLGRLFEDDKMQWYFIFRNNNNVERWRGRGIVIAGKINENDYFSEYVGGGSSYCASGFVVFGVT